LPWVDRFAALVPSCQPRDEEVTWEAELADEDLEAEAEDKKITALLTSPIRELFQDLVPDEQLQEAARKKVKSCYSCPHCKTNVWGKPGLKLLCGECGEAYEEQEAA
jgi:hypothetical protein